MRDLAGQRQATDPPAAEVPAVDAAEAEVAEKPLPPNESLPLGAGESDLFGAGSAGQGGTSSLGDGWVLSTLAALGVVLVIVFGIRWLLRRGGVVSTSMPQGSVVEVLSRTTVAPRSHVVLMRVGQRILVVSDSPSGMRTLASVHEAEEVAELLGTIDASRPASMTHSFGSVMKKLSGQWAGEADELDGGLNSAASASVPATDLDQTHDTVSSLRGRLAALSGAGGKA